MHPLQKNLLAAWIISILLVVDEIRSITLSLQLEKLNQLSGHLVKPIRIVFVVEYVGGNVQIASD